MLGRPMVLAGSDAKQVQWTNVYQDALVWSRCLYLLLLSLLLLLEVVIIQNVKREHSVTDVLFVVVFIGPWHGYNWDFARVQSHHERRLTGDVRTESKMFIIKQNLEKQCM